MALVVTIVVLLILAGITINTLLGDNGLINKAKDASELTKRENAVEKVKLMLANYSIERVTGTKTLEEYLNEQKTKGELDKVTNNGDRTITVEVDGYEITIKEDDLSIVNAEKAGGVRPVFEVTTTKIDGGSITSSEEGSLTQKAITINITNVAEFGENYTIEVKDSKGTTITKEANVITGVTGQASYKITKKGDYTIKVTGTKDGITKDTTKTETITLVKAQVEESAVKSTLKANGVIDIVWLNEDNTIREKPLSPADHLCGMTAIKYNDTTKEEEIVSSPATDTSWYNYEAQAGKTEKKGTSKWANARNSNSDVYFVWIPRYAYKITYFDTPENANAYRANSNSKTGIIGYSNIEGIIAIVDGTEKLVTGSEPTNVIGTVKNSKYSEYIPHPAFQFGEGKAGIWVGKFESSGSTSAVKIIPNTESLKSVKVGQIFTACQGVKTTYKLTAGDTHMMKNTEWGAVAYLAESKYGRNGTEIGMNSSNYTTGAGDYKSNVLQSTTGNINGIYDMNGTSWEYVAGILSSYKSNGNNTDKNNYYNFSNSTTYPNKYFDWYTNYTESKNIKGDGVYETSTSGSNSTSWHSGYSNFVNLSYPVFRRGWLLQ